MDIVYVDLDLADIKDGTSLTYQVKSSTGESSAIALGTTADPKTEIIEVQKTALANAIIRVKVFSVQTEGNPGYIESYQVKGKLISTKGDKTDGYQIILMAAVEKAADGSPDYFPVAYATTETNGYFVTGFLIFNKPEDADRVIAAKAVVTKDDKNLGTAH
jgi:hypothetical protein